MSELSELAENVKLNGIVRKDNWLDIEDEKKARDDNHPTKKFVFQNTIYSKWKLFHVELIYCYKKY